MMCSVFIVDNFMVDRVITSIDDGLLMWFWNYASMHMIWYSIFYVGSNLTEEKFDGFKDAGTNVSPAVSRRDMATQMSPEGSSCSSPNMRPSFSASTPSALPVTELQSVSFCKMDIRDVQVDERVTMTRWSKKHRALFSGRDSENVDCWKKKETSTQSSSWDISERSKTVSKYVYFGIVSILFNLSGK